MSRFLEAKRENLNNVLAAMRDGAAEEPDFKPLLLHLEITTRCNLRCLKCGHATDPPGTARIMPRHLAYSVVDSFDQYFEAAARIHTFGYGEMFLYSRLHQLVDKLKSFQCSVDGITNGVLVNRKEVDWLVECGYDELTISIDGVEPDTMSRLRGVDVEKIWSMLEYLKNRKKELGRDRPRIVVNFVAQSDNFEELPDLVRKLSTLDIYFLGVNALMKESPSDGNGVYAKLYREFSLANAPRERVATALSDGARLAQEAGIAFAAYIDLDALYSETQGDRLVQIIPDKNGSRPAAAEKLEAYYCAYPWMAAYVHADGGARVCCYMDGEIGAVQNSDDFKAVWNNGKINEIRNAIRNGEVHPACGKCVKAGRYQHSLVELESIKSDLAAV